MRCGLFVLALMIGCAAPPAAPKERPNILWIYVEDMNAWMSCYGDTIVRTPNIDALAARGARFENCFMPAAVCSPVRSALITGAMQTTLGIHNHRSSRVRKKGEPIPDPIHLPAGVKTIPELFRAAGYYTFNQGKTDYNFVYDTADLYSGADGKMGFKGARNGSEWAGRKPGQPFFGQIQLRGGKNRPKKKPVDRSKVPIPPYYADHPIIREEIAHHYNCVLQTDDEVGQIVARLKEDRLLGKTVIFFFTDHGMRGIRHKQWLYDGGIHVPLVIAGPGVGKAVRKDLMSGLDIPATSLVLAGLSLPDHADGRDLFASDYREREFVVSAKDRCDYTIDRVRSVRTKRFKYIRNFLTDRPAMQPQYRDGRPYLEIMKQLHREGKLNGAQAFFMQKKRPAEELYDLWSDPHEVRNLAEDPVHRQTLGEMRATLSAWIEETGDKGQTPESIAGLKAVLMRWSKQAVNPEYGKAR